MSQPSFMEATPTSLKEISPAWWAVVFNGHLWAVNLDIFEVPNVSVSTFRQYAYRRSIQHNVTAHIRTSSKHSTVYIQRVAHKWASMDPATNAKAAPGLPKVPKIDPAAPLVDWDEHMRILEAGYAGNPLGKAMLEHEPEVVRATILASMPPKPPAPVVPGAVIAYDVAQSLPPAAVEVLKAQGFAIGAAYNGPPAPLDPRAVAAASAQLAAVCTCDSADPARHQPWCLAAGGSGMPPAQPAELPDFEAGANE